MKMISLRLTVSIPSKSVSSLPSYITLRIKLIWQKIIVMVQTLSTNRIMALLCFLSCQYEAIKARMLNKLTKIKMLLNESNELLNRNNWNRRDLLYAKNAC